MKDYRNIVDKQLQIGLYNSQIRQRYVTLDGHDLMQSARIVFLDPIENLEEQKREIRIN